MFNIMLRFCNSKYSVGYSAFQERLGRECEIFRIVKFKIMTNEHDIHGNLLQMIDCYLLLFNRK